MRACAFFPMSLSHLRLSVSLSPPAAASLGSAAVDIEPSVELTFGCPRFSCLPFFQRAVDGRRAGASASASANQSARCPRTAKVDKPHLHVCSLFRGINREGAMPSLWNIQNAYRPLGPSFPLSSRASGVGAFSFALRRKCSRVKLDALFDGSIYRAEGRAPTRVTSWAEERFD
jgi:hypothetical protein